MRPIKKPKEGKKKEKAKKTESDGCEKDEDELSKEERDVVSANANETMVSNSPPTSQRYGR